MPRDDGGIVPYESKGVITVVYIHTPYAGRSIRPYEYTVILLFRRRLYPAFFFVNSAYWLFKHTLYFLNDVLDQSVVTPTVHPRVRIRLFVYNGKYKITRRRRIADRKRFGYRRIGYGAV